MLAALIFSSPCFRKRWTDQAKRGECHKNQTKQLSTDESHQTWVESDASVTVVYCWVLAVNWACLVLVSVFWWLCYCVLHFGSLNCFLFCVPVLSFCVPVLSFCFGFLLLLWVPVLWSKNGFNFLRHMVSVVCCLVLFVFLPKRLEFTDVSLEKM